MVHITAEVKRWGNSLGIILPAQVSKKIELKVGEKVELDIGKRHFVDGFGLLKGSKSFSEEKETHKKF